jgi:hypothetical protein
MEVGKMKKKGLFLAIATVLVLSCNAQADLVERGEGTINGGSDLYKLIYDDVLDITWLDYTNSKDEWDNQTSWADNLEVNYNNVVFKEWRLPSAGDAPEIGYNKRTSEMGHLYHESLEQPVYGPLGDTDPFVQLVADYYWTGTEYNDNQTWTFDFASGYQEPEYKSYVNLALGVMDGDIASVPLPAAVWLFGSGLMGLVGIRRRFGVTK